MYNQYNTQFLEAGPQPIDGMLWDTLTYTSAATTRLTFFTATRATIDLSNMRAAGHLPRPESFFVRAIRVFVKQRPESQDTAAATNPEPGAINSLVLLLNTGVLTVMVGQKNYGIYPIHMLPAGGGAFGAMAVNNILVGGAAADYGQNGYPHTRNIFALANPFTIPTEVNFYVMIDWAAAVTLIRNVNICVALDGDAIRPLQ